MRDLKQNPPAKNECQPADEELGAWQIEVDSVAANFTVDDDVLLAKYNSAVGNRSADGAGDAEEEEAEVEEVEAEAEEAEEREEGAEEPPVEEETDTDPGMSSW